MDKLFAFSKDQIRIVLFRECDFRGRKLLFDSNCIQKVSSDDKTNPNYGKFITLPDGYGYFYSAIQPDVQQLSEMIFGTVAMSYRGTYSKIHSLDRPTRLMFSQTFPSPWLDSKKTNSSLSSSSFPHASTHSFDHSSLKLDDSGVSSVSICERLSVHSSTSDTVLVTKRPHSSPLDVPKICASYHSVVGDSGCSFDHSTSSIWESIAFGSKVCKRWLRRNSLSHSGSSLTSVSLEEFAVRPAHKRIKLGFALIIELTTKEEERSLTTFLMEHVLLIESLLWRMRRIIEKACIKTCTFLSIMIEVVNVSTHYLVSLLSDSYLSMNMWLLVSGCDKHNSISAFSGAVCNNNTINMTILDMSRSSSSTTFNIGNDLKKINNKNSCEYHINTNLFNLSKFFKSDLDLFHYTKKNFTCNQHLDTFNSEQFLKEFCELLEALDIKDTNFFMSTLLTAVLTHHLGWVETCLPSNESLIPQTSYNILWGQLNDLFGAAGHPIKMAQTIVTGTTNKHIITKILKSLTYFIRCVNIKRRTVYRENIDGENQIVDSICNQQSCIPKENFKKYEDHLKEILVTEILNHKSNNKTENSNIIIQEKETITLKKNYGLTKNKTGLKNLLDLMGDDQQQQNNINNIDSNLTLDNECMLNEIEKCNKVSKLSTKNSVEYLNIDEDEQNLVSFKNDEQSVSNRSNNNNVIFVLGDDDRLVNLKKQYAKRPNFLNVCKFNDSNFVKTTDFGIPSTSWSNKIENHKSSCIRRAQSMPPVELESIDKVNENLKTKYSGIKFSLQQYPQILSNYMRSKNLEMSNIQFGDKELTLEFDDSLTSNFKFDGQYEEIEALQTPSNASELEFTSDLQIQQPTIQHAKEITTKTDSLPTFVKRHLPNTFIKEPTKENINEIKMKIVNLPMPKTCINENNDSLKHVHYTKSLMRNMTDMYLPDMVLQGITMPKVNWEETLKNDLIVSSQQRSLIDQPIEEAVAIIANCDTWEVQLMSSHTFIVDKGSTGIRVGMSPLVANMLESLLQLWKLNVPSHYCLMHIEQGLQELCVRSKALAQLLLATEFCSIELLTNTLHLEVNDVPLLLAVASTHTPQVTQKYGLSFQ